MAIASAIAPVCAAWTVCSSGCSSEQVGPCKGLEGGGEGWVWQSGEAIEEGGEWIGPGKEVGLALEAPAECCQVTLL